MESLNRAVKVDENGYKGTKVGKDRIYAHLVGIIGYYECKL